MPDNANYYVIYTTQRHSTTAVFHHRIMNLPFDIETADGVGALHSLLQTHYDKANAVVVINWKKLN
jgi:hypothetical protein